METLLRFLLGFSKEKLGGAFYPMPAWLRRYLNRFPTGRRLQVYARLMDGRIFYKNAPPDLACAESATTIISTVFPGSIPVVTGTWTMLDAMLRTPRTFTEVTSPVDGCVVIAATGTGNGSIPGHVGIYDRGRVWSNNSSATLSNNPHAPVPTKRLVGRWDAHFSLLAFKDRYFRIGGMKVRYFIINQ